MSRLAFNKQERKFTAFEDKTIDEQADDITTALLYQEENPLFEFDNKDQAIRYEFTKACTGAAIFVVLTNAISLRHINNMKGGKTMGPLRKFALLNFLNLPFYWYFYNDVNNHYLSMKRHLVTRYLIAGDEILYKRPIQK